MHLNIVGGVEAIQRRQSCGKHYMHKALQHSEISHLEKCSKRASLCEFQGQLILTPLPLSVPAL